MNYSLLPMLCRVARTWENVNSDHADVKELIPEFYQPPGDFLLNLQI
jgi:factor associated with neutral sphingomyelinase activation